MSGPVVLYVVKDVEEEEEEMLPVATIVQYVCMYE